VISPELREYAEIPDRFAPIPEGSSVSRYDDGRVCVVQGRTWASVTGVDVGADQVEALLDEVHERVSPDKTCTWWLGPSTVPADLPERLIALGLSEPLDEVPKVLALALAEEPAPPPEEVDVRIAETYDDYVAAREVQWDAFHVPEERRARQRAHLEKEYEEAIRFDVPVTFVAELEGRVAATAMAIPSDRGVFLIAGSTAPWARGRGLYRALVHARWEFGVARGTPALVTQADPATSYPILKRLGFEDVCEVRRLEDRRNS
jgi:predicted N-acetyltransferase YhbS